MNEKEDKIKNEIKKYIKKEFLEKGQRLTNSTKLFDKGIIDSLGIIKLTVFIEKKYKTTINPSQARIENFETINKIYKLIKKK